MTGEPAPRRRCRLRAALVGGPLAAGVLAVALVAHGSGASSARVPLASAMSVGRRAPAPDPGPIGPEGVPVPAACPLAAPASPAFGKSVDGIACGASEQLVFHIHAHLTIFVAGAPRAVPFGVGIAPPLQVLRTAHGLYAAGGNRFSFLHTHAADGIIHVESPVERTYTLGEFFDVWEQPLGRGRVGSATGRVTTFVGGRRYLGDPRAVPLVVHAQIQLDIGRPIVGPQSIRFPASL
jgi:hypothetical protein